MKAEKTTHSLIAKKVMARKKIWDIANGYKCSLMGICLGLEELRKLGKEKVFDIHRDATDYYLHCCFIRFSDQRGEKAAVLQRYLEKKFKAKARKYLKATTDEALLALWHTDMAEGRVDIAWWGILTHPEASAELVNQLYSELHMMGHQCFRHWHRNRLRMADLEETVTRLTDTLTQERRQYRQDKGLWDQEKKELNRDMALLRTSQAKHVSSSETQSAREPMMDMKAVQVQALQDQISTLQGQLRAAHARLDEQAEQEKQWRAEQGKLSDEIAVLEKMIAHFSSGTAPCETCSSQNTQKCPGLDLCGKTVLYVGGHHKMVARYRQLVEQCGGRFVHHDGGKETSRSLLPKMLLTADAVVCPIDCISHDACTRAKKMCKRYQKPFVPMRSSGLSALAKGLDELVQ
ncbi:DUF2325 domain-containing protein [Desulfosarcina sp. OttesenSCG-928-A07]|nr:DUF2325 domain-containing protein [Desulfosarcina sp. OttesenSCG-928-G17]MDL2329715.1 DUF2325 domain-containing protein [Desulfosarcina sp. OttesenSCG-928-A07]